MARTAEEALAALGKTCDYGDEQLLEDGLRDLTERVRRLEQAADPSMPSAERDWEFEQAAEEMTRSGTHYRGRRGE